MPLMLTLAAFLCAAEPASVAKPAAEPVSEDTPATLKKIPVYPKTVAVLKDVAYLGGTRKEKADIYSPLDHDKAKPLPGIIVIHGGGFNDGDKARGRELNISENLTLKGYVCMSINYKLRRMQGQVTWPQSLYDAKAAVRYLRKEAAGLGVDPEKIGVIGCSAGCNLAMMLATTGLVDGFDAVPGEPYQDVSARVACAIGFYGAVDLMNYHDMKMFAKTREEAPELYKKVADHLPRRQGSAHAPRPWHGRHHGAAQPERNLSSDCQGKGSPLRARGHSRRSAYLRLAAQAARPPPARRGLLRSAPQGQQAK